MSEHPTIHLTASIPEIPVYDLEAAIAYYRDKFGFNLDWSDGEIGLAGLSLNECRLFLANMVYRNKYGKVIPVRVWMNLDSKDDVDKLHQEWRDRGATIDAEPQSKPWGLHEFVAADPDGNQFQVFYDFATPERDK